MAEFGYDQTRNCFFCTDVIDPGEDSNFWRIVMATSERLAATGLFRWVFSSYMPMHDAPQVDYPYAAVFPEELPETERTNIENLKTYGVLILIGTMDDQRRRGTARMLAIRQASELVCRSKRKIEMMDGDIHENTLLDSTTLIEARAEGSSFVFGSGYRIHYEVTEPREEE